MAEDVYTSAVSVWSHFVNLIIGRAGELTRSTSVFKVLGDLSVMTFVDKTGILAEPIPQPVKVFLFSDDEDPSNEDGPPSPTVHTGDTSNKAIELDLIHSHAFKPTGGVAVCFTSSHYTVQEWHFKTTLGTTTSLP